MYASDEGSHNTSFKNFIISILKSKLKLHVNADCREQKEPLIKLAANSLLSCK